MDAGGRVTQEAKTEGLRERGLAHSPSPQPSPVNGRGGKSAPHLPYTLL